jgi:predicted O-methyltransferase YrrM
MIGEGNISPYTGVPGWIEAQESEALRALTESLIGKEAVHIANIGCEYGRTASEFASVSPLVHVLAVDLFPLDHGIVGDLLAAFKANTAAWARQIEVLQGNSQTVKPSNAKRKYDLVFIDAGHHYEEIKADIANWANRVRAGGVLVFHDYAKGPFSHSQHFDVKRAVDEWQAGESGWQKVSGPGSLVWFVRS